VVHFSTQQLEKQGVIKGRTGFLTAEIKAGGGVRKELVCGAFYAMPLAQRKARHATFSSVFVHPEDPASDKNFNAANIWSMYCWERQVLVLSVRLVGPCV
jgi:hypothetical protein